MLKVYKLNDKFHLLLREQRLHFENIPYVRYEFPRNQKVKFLTRKTQNNLKFFSGFSLHTFPTLSLKESP